VVFSFFSVQGENRRIIARRNGISLPIDLSALRICHVGDLYQHAACIPGVESLHTLLGGPPRTPCSSEFLSPKSRETGYWKQSKWYFVNVERGNIADKLQPRNINVSFSNNSNVAIDVIIFTFYSDQLTIDVETGIVTK